MHNVDFRALAASSWWRRKSFWVVGAFGVFSFVLWVLPNWRTFWENVSRFPDLWQIPGNRIIIVYLCIKMLSPLIIMGIITLLIWIASFMQVESQVAHREDSPRVSSQTRQTVTPAQESRRPVVLYPRLSASISARRVPNPETPLPPVLATEGAYGQTNLARENEPTPPLSLTFAQPVVPKKGYMIGSSPLISIHLLKDVTIALCVPESSERVIVPLSLNAKRVQLLAYIAWRRGELIDRDKILEHVFGWGLSDEEATEEKLAERFESHKKLLRRKVREVIVKQINQPAGRQIIDPEIDLFVNDAGFWGLSDVCHVDDLEELERNYKVIATARKEGRLVGSVPDQVFKAADRIIAVYSGDFLETIIKKYPGEFRSWQGYASWAKKPYTLYRDYYLDALWYVAEYEWRMGQLDQDKRLECFGRAAQTYQKYAMYACNSRFDAKTNTERIGMSERALRRSIVLLGAIQSTDLVNQVWSAYCAQMKNVSDSRWQPSKETLADVEEARSQTNAYRFAAQMRELSGAFADKREDAS